MKKKHVNLLYRRVFACDFPLALREKSMYRHVTVNKSIIPMHHDGRIAGHSMPRFHSAPIDSAPPPLHPNE